MKKLLPLLLCLLLLTGCAPHGTEEQLMVVLLSVDIHQDDTVQVSVKAPGFSGSNSPEGASADGYLILTAQGTSLPDALAWLYATAPRTLNYSQTRQILISHEVLSRFPDIIHQLSRIDGIRSQAMLCVCQGCAFDVLKVQKAVIGTRLSRYIDTTQETALREGYIPDSTLIRTLSRLHGGYQDALVSVCAPDPTGNADGKQQENAAQASAQAPDTIAGSDLRTTGKAVQWLGSAAMNDGIIAGYLSGFDTMLCRFLTGDIGTLPFETDNGLVSLTPRYGPHLSIAEADDHITLTVTANLNLLPKLGTEVDLQAIRLSLIDRIESLITFLQSMGADALGFGSVAIRHFSTLDAWQQSNWKHQYRNADLSVDISFTLTDE